MKRIHIFQFQGGLGNQMFQYAFLLALKYINPTASFLWDIHYCKGAHQGFELFNIFNIGGGRISTISTWILTSKLRKYILRHFSTVTDSGKDYTFIPEVLKQKNNSFYDGYWQSYKYFQDIEGSIKKYFRFKGSLISEKNKELADTMHNQNSVSIHIRRGDYLSINGGSIVLSLSYYKQAIELINQKLDNPIFYVFSDDSAYVKEIFTQSNFVVIDHNVGKNSWQDMYLMSSCRNNIIANSSFSWWGAYLNNTPDKIVISPQWSYDLIPETWIQI